MGLGFLGLGFSWGLWYRVQGLGSLGWSLRVVPHMRFRFRGLGLGVSPNQRYFFGGPHNKDYGYWNPYCGTLCWKIYHISFGTISLLLMVLGRGGCL